MRVELPKRTIEYNDKSMERTMSQNVPPAAKFFLKILQSS
jgi:hypothetical protein